MTVTVYVLIMELQSLVRKEELFSLFEQIFDLLLGSG